MSRYTIPMLAALVLAACENSDCETCESEPCEWQAAIVDCAADVCPNASAAGVAPCVESCIAEIDCAPASPLDRAYEREGAIAEISGDGDAWCGWRETEGAP